MARQRWLDSEPSALTGLRQASDLWRRGLRRPWLVLLITTVLAGGVVGAVFVLKQQYAPVFMLRVKEADRDPASMPRLKRQLADYARQAVMTSEPLLQIMRKHGLYGSLVRKNTRAALQSFREDISVQVYQNYFLEERSARDLPRSARLAVSYRAKDPMVALAVTRELGALIIDHERNVRREQASLAAQQAVHEREALKRLLQQRSGDIVAKQGEVTRPSAEDMRPHVQLIGMLGAVSALEHELEVAERRSAALEVAAALERGGVGLYFEVVDEGALPPRAGKVESLLILFGAVFATGLPLIAVSIGAFTPPRGQA